MTSSFRPLLGGGGSEGGSEIVLPRLGRICIMLCNLNVSLLGLLSLYPCCGRASVQPELSVCIQRMIDMDFYPVGKGHFIISRFFFSTYGFESLFHGTGTV